MNSLNWRNKMRYYFYVVFGLIAFVMSGCSTSVKNIDAPTSEHNGIPTSTIAFQPTKSSLTAINSPTPLPITVTPTGSNMTIDLTPTLTPNEREAYLLKYFSTETGCKFPCWLGATPGVTSFREFQLTLQRLGIKTSPIDVNPNQKQEIKLGGVDFDSKEVLNRITIVVESDGIISEVEGVLHGYLNPREFAESWDVIDIKHLLLDYGVPSNITVKADYNDSTGRVAYSIGVIYVTQGFAVYYNGATDYQSTTNICPNLSSYQIIAIVFSLQAPPFKEASNSVESILTELNTGLSVNDLYTLFTGSTRPCLIISSEELK